MKGVGETKFDRPTTDSFIRDIDAALRQQIFNVPGAQGKSEVQPDGVLDDLGWKPVAAIGDGVHWRLIAQQRELRVSVTVPCGRKRGCGASGKSQALLRVSFQISPRLAR
jgi:hypothetical protein